MCLVLMCIAFFFLLMSRQPISTRPDTLFPSPTCVRAQLRQSRKAVTARIEARSVARATAEVVEADEPALVALGGVVRVDQQLDEIGIDRFVLAPRFAFARGGRGSVGGGNRSEEHTSELQSLMRISYAVFCLKKKKNTIKTRQHSYTQYAHRIIHLA